MAENGVRRLAMAKAAKSGKQKPKLGSGKRFSALKKSLAGRKGVTNAGALAAYIGRKKYGAKKFASLGKKGK